MAKSHGSPPVSSLASLSLQNRKRARWTMVGSAPRCALLGAVLRFLMHQQQQKRDETTAILLAAKISGSSDTLTLEHVYQHPSNINQPALSSASKVNQRTLPVQQTEIAEIRPNVPAIRQQPKTPKPETLSSSFRVNPVFHRDHRFAYVVERYKLIFFPIPKNACTQWKLLFRRIMGLPDLDVKAKTSLVHDPEQNGLVSLGYYTPQQASDMIVSPNWTKAVFLRDPLERWLSAYLDKGVKERSIVRRCCHQNPQHAYCRDAHLNQTNVPLSPKEAFGIMKQCNDKHWIPQSRRIRPPYAERMTFIGYTHSQERDSEALLRQIGAWDEFGATGWGKNGKDRIFLNPKEPAGTTVMKGGGGSLHGQHHATQAKDKYEQYISPELEAQLLEYYRGDYESPYFNFTLPRPRQQRQQSK